jgi:hypothetical protein
MCESESVDHCSVAVVDYVPYLVQLQHVLV